MGRDGAYDHPAEPQSRQQGSCRGYAITLAKWGCGVDSPGNPVVRSSGLGSPAASLGLLEGAQT